MPMYPRVGASSYPQGASYPSGVAYSGASMPVATPQVLFDFFNAGELVLDSSGNKTCAFFQEADHIVASNLVLWYPYADQHPSSANDPSAFFASLLIYDETKDLHDLTAYQAPNLIDLLTPGASPGVPPVGQPGAYGFGGGIVDDTQSFIYLPCARGWDPTAGSPPGSGASFANPLMLQINVAALKTDPLNSLGNTYKLFDVRSISVPPTHFGGFMGIYSNGYVYFCPTQDHTTNVQHGFLLRCHVGLTNQQVNFQDQTRWEWINLQAFNPLTGPAAIAQGFQSMCVDANGKIYLIPFGNGFSALVCFDPNGPGGVSSGNGVTGHGTSSLQSAGPGGNYTWLDTTTIPGSSQLGGPRGFTGANLIAGRYLLLVPWKDNSMFNPADGAEDSWQNNLLYACVLYDTTLSLSTAHCNVFDLTRISNGPGRVAAGYEDAWIDKAGIVWLIPTGIYKFGAHTCLPLAAWVPDYSNVAGGSVWASFTDPTRWFCIQDPNFHPGNPGATGSQSGSIPGATGAAYDPVTDRAWLSSVVPSAAFPIDPTFPYLSRGVICQITIIR